MLQDFIELDEKRIIRKSSITSIELVDDKDEMSDYYNDDELIKKEIILVINSNVGTYLLEEDLEILFFLEKLGSVLENTYKEYRQKLI